MTTVPGATLRVTAMSGCRAWMPDGRLTGTAGGPGLNPGVGPGLMIRRGDLPHSIMAAGVMWAKAGRGFLDEWLSARFMRRRLWCSLAAHGGPCHSAEAEAVWPGSRLLPARSTFRLIA